MKRAMRVRGSIGHPLLLLGLVSALAACAHDSSRDAGATSASAGGGGVSASGAPSAREGAASPTAGAGAPGERSVYFDFDNSLIHDADLPLLQKNARYLVAHPSQKLTIEGHCDERGSNEYNLALGERRALAAKKLLESYGVGDQQISVVTYGSEKPRATCHQEECWKQNRRGDLVYTPS